MQKSLFVVLFFLGMTVTAWAGEGVPFDPDQPFQKALSNNLLRSFLNQTLDQLDDHLEISGYLVPDETTGDRDGHLRLKFYPEGKTTSDKPLTAEGWFRLTPDDRVRDFSLHFRNPEAPVGKVPRQSDDVL